MAAVVDEDEKVVALGVARPVDRPGFGVLPFYANEGGRSLHIDLLVDISDTTESIFVMRDLIFARFGPRETVAMFRHGESDTALKVYRWDRYWQNISRIKRVKMKKEKEYGTAKSADAHQITHSNTPKGSRSILKICRPCCGRSSRPAHNMIRNGMKNSRRCKPNTGRPNTRSSSRRGSNLIRRDMGYVSRLGIKSQACCSKAG
jgi:hypothetical protein